MKPEYRGVRSSRGDDSDGGFERGWLNLSRWYGLWKEGINLILEFDRES